MKKHIVTSLVFILFIITQTVKAQELFNKSTQNAKIEYKPFTNYFEYNNVEKNTYLSHVSVKPLTIVKSNMYSFSNIATDIIPIKPTMFKNHANSKERKYYSLAKTAISILADVSLKLTAKTVR